MSKYSLYSSGCPNCKALEAMLTNEQLPVDIIYSTTDEMLAKGWRSTPILVNNETGETLTFFEAYRRIKEHTL